MKLHVEHKIELCGVVLALILILIAGADRIQKLTTMGLPTATPEPAAIVHVEYLNGHKPGVNWSTGVLYPAIHKFDLPAGWSIIQSESFSVYSSDPEVRRLRSDSLELAYRDAAYTQIFRFDCNEQRMCDLDTTLDDPYQELSADTTWGITMTVGDKTWYVSVAYLGGEFDTRWNILFAEPTAVASWTPTPEPSIGIGIVIQ